MANMKIGMSFFEDKLKCGVEKRNGFEGLVLLREEKYVRFFLQNTEVRSEVFMAASKKAKKILQTFNKYVKSDNFSENPSITVERELVKLDFVRDAIKNEKQLRLKGGPALSA